jgi:hypothetical protein
MAANLKDHGWQDVVVDNSLADVGLAGAVKARNLWAHSEADLTGAQLPALLSSHGSALFLLSEDPRH